MSAISHHIHRWSIVIVALTIFVLAALLGGPRSISDVGTIRWLAGERALHDGLSSSAIAVTAVGGAPGMIAILLLSLVGLALARRWRDAAAMALIVLTGRGMVELIKLAVNRPRPHFGPWPVRVESLSFPSGHAANSMITFLAIALIAAPVRCRNVAVAAAVALSVTIGATRPFLGVHWPSDVVAGWAFGIGWVVALTLLVEQQHKVVGGHAATLA